METNNDNYLAKNEILIVNLLKNETIFKYDLTNGSHANVKMLAIDTNLDYLTFLDEDKLIWLYRVRDNYRLACLPLYGEARQIKFNLDNRFLCLNMNDRRVFSMLIVDPERKDHLGFVEGLKSRKVDVKNKNDEENEESDEEINKDAKMKVLDALAEDSYSDDDDQVDSTSDSTDTSDQDEVEKEVKKRAQTNGKKSAHDNESDNDDFSRNKSKIFHSYKNI